MGEKGETMANGNGTISSVREMTSNMVAAVGFATVMGLIIWNQSDDSQTADARIVAAIEAQTVRVDARLDKLEANAAGYGDPGVVERGFGQLEKDLDKHEDAVGHIGTVESLTALKEHFTEVETQFRELRGNMERDLQGQADLLGEQIGTLRKRAEIDETWRLEYDINAVAKNAAQDERIRTLERELYGSNNPAPSTSSDILGGQ